MANRTDISFSLALAALLFLLGAQAAHATTLGPMTAYVPGYDSDSVNETVPVTFLSWSVSPESQMQAVIRPYLMPLHIPSTEQAAPERININPAGTMNLSLSYDFYPASGPCHVTLDLTNLTEPAVPEKQLSSISLQQALERTVLALSQTLRSTGYERECHLRFAGKDNAHARRLDYTGKLAATCLNCDPERP